MNTESTAMQRRKLLQMGATLAAVAGPALHDKALAAVKPPLANGKQGDFAFLNGEWQIKNRQLRAGEWLNFDSEATVYGILDGIGSVEELRIPTLVGADRKLSHF